MASKSIFDEAQRKALFHKLYKMPIWMSKKSRHKQSARADCDRQETFLGKVLGGQALPDGFEHLPFFGGKSRTVKEKSSGAHYTLNDPNGLSQDWGWLDRVEELGVLSKHAAIALSEILSRAEIKDRISQEDALSYLQCNINLYGSDSTLPPHRDDCTQNRKPTTHTFFPAAITYVLSDGSALHQFELYHCKTCESRGDGTRIYEINAKMKEQCVIHEGEGGNLAPKDGHRVLANFCQNENVEIRLHGSNYLYGVHRVFAPKSQNLGANRMSLNFRIVRPDTWSVFSKSK